MTLKEYKELVESQGEALLDIVQAVALGDLDVEIEVPEGVDVLSDLAIGLEMMVDDIREMITKQERITAEVKQSQRQMQEAMDELLGAQRRYLQDAWEEYAPATEASRGYYRFGDEAGPTADAWLPSMMVAAEKAGTVVKENGEATVAMPIQLYGEVIGVVGLSREEPATWSKEEIAAVEDLLDQMAQALEGQRLTDEVQQASHLLEDRVRELDLLNEIGRKIDETPQTAEFLEWVAERIPDAMQYPDLCVAAIEFEGDIYGSSEAVSLPYQMVQGLRIGEQQLGKAYIAYKERRDFLNAESAMLGDIVRRVSGYVENRRLFQQTQTVLSETETLYAGSERVVQATTSSEVLQALVESTALQRLDRVSIALFDRPWTDVDPEEAIITAAWQRSGQAPGAPAGTRYPLAHMPAIDTVASGQATILRDLATDERVGDALRALLIDQLGMRSMGLWPLVAGGQWIGLLTGQSGVVMDVDDGERRQIASLVDQAASVLQTFRQVEQTEARARREQALREITARVRGFTDPDTVVRTAVRELGTALGRPTFIRLGNAQELSQPPAAPQTGDEATQVAATEK